MKPSIYLSIPEAAARLGVTRQRVHQWIQSGHLRAIRIGGRWIVSAREVEKFEAARKSVRKAQR